MGILLQREWSERYASEAAQRWDQRPFYAKLRQQMELMKQLSDRAQQFEAQTNSMSRALASLL